MLKFLLHKIIKPRPERYLFIGFLKPLNKKNCFASSVYKKNNEYYIQELNREVIENFQKVIIKGEISYVSKNDQIEKAKGEEPIYCFITNDKSVYGNKKEIAPRLMDLLFSESVNTYTGLIISSFLQLHGKTQQYLENAGNKNSNFNIHFNQNDFIDTKQLHQINKTQFLDKIFSKLDELQNINPILSLDDVALFKDSRVFFDISDCSIRDVLFDENATYNNVFKKLMTMSSRVYYQMLTSSNTVNQEKIDSILSRKAADISEESVLDIGLHIETKLARQRWEISKEVKETENVTSGETADKENYESLIKVANKIKLQMTE